MPRRILYWLPALLLLGAVPAKAYVDPGSGSFLIQMLIAGLLGASIDPENPLEAAQGPTLVAANPSTENKAARPRPTPHRPVASGPNAQAQSEPRALASGGRTHSSPRPNPHPSNPRHPTADHPHPAGPTQAPQPPGNFPANKIASLTACTVCDCFTWRLRLKPTAECRRASRSTMLSAFALRVGQLCCGGPVPGCGHDNLIARSAAALPRSAATQRRNRTGPAGSPPRPGFARIKFQAVSGRARR